MNKAPFPCSKRTFLAAAGTMLSGLAFYDPVRELLRSMVSGMVASARSREVGGRGRFPARNFVQFNLYGAPTRWQFDHALRPYEDNHFLQAPGVYNRIAKMGASVEGEYADVLVHGIRLPHLWSCSVLDAAGGLRPLSELAAHMMVIRGCNMGMNGHPLPNALQVCLPSGPSITAMVADAGDFCLPAIGVGRAPASQAYRSNRGSFALNIPADHDDYVSYMLDPFFGVQARPDAEGLEQAIAAMQAYGTSGNPGAETLYRDRRNAERLLKLGLDNLRSAFPPLVAKYDRIFHGSMHCSPLSGVTDLPIPGVRLPLETGDNESIETAFAAYHLDSRILCGADLRRIFDSARADYLAKQFALTEFVLVHGLSGSVLLSPPDPLEQANCLFTGLGDFEYFPRSAIFSVRDKKIGRQRFESRESGPSREVDYRLITDSHDTGWLANVVSCNLFFRGFGACMLELVNRLKETPSSGGTLFDDTIIQVASEFDRIPSSRGFGLSHNPRASITSIFTGLVKEPLVLGNIYVGSANHPGGTVGFAAPVRGLKDKSVTIGNLSSTLSELLRVDKADPGAQPLVSVHSGQIVPEIERARNVEDPT